MNANDTSPCGGNEGSDSSYNYETVAQTLLRQELELRAYGVRNAFVNVSRKTERGDDLDEEDIRKLRGQLKHAQLLVDVIEKGVSDD